MYPVRDEHINDLDKWHSTRFSHPALSEIADVLERSDIRVHFDLVRHFLSDW